MSVKEMISTGALIIGGIIVLKAFGGVKGITGMVSGVGQLLSFGESGAVGGGSSLTDTIENVTDITEMPKEDVSLIADVSQTEAQGDLLQTIASLGVGPIFGPLIGEHIIQPYVEQQVGEILEEYAESKPTYTPSPTLPTPEAEPVWIEEPDMVSDIARPQGSFGGR